MTGTAAALPREEDGSAGNRPVVLLLGAGKRVSRVSDMMTGLGLGCHIVPDPLAVLEDTNRKDAGLIVIVPPLSDLSASDFCRRLRRRPNRADIPILVVGSARESRRLYQAGASGQFDWPGGQAAFVRAVLRLMGQGVHEPPSNARDAALASKIQERLRAERHTVGSLVTAQVRRGVVILGGEVDSLWKVSELERILLPIPGVQDVVTSHVRVPVSALPDRSISSSVWHVLRSAAGLESRTFATRVSNGRVVLSGTAASRHELNRVVGLIEQVDGVRSIENLAVIAPRTKIREGRLARKLSRLTALQFPRSEVRVSVFGKIAVLSGKTRNPTERRAIEQLAGFHPHIDRIISKLSS